MSLGKDLRLRRIIDPASGSSLMFAYSHGTSSPEVLEGLERPVEMIGAAARGGADCVFVAPGLVASGREALAAHAAVGLIVKVTATASRAALRHQEILTASVAHALSIGADGIVALLPFAPDNEPEVIRLTAEIGEACTRWGIPFIAEAEYPNAYYGEMDYAKEWGVSYLKRSARLCVELGADIVKSNWTGSGETFAEIVDSVPVPVVVAGGSRESDAVFLQKLADAREAGAIGCSVGRNVFQHTTPEAMVRAICDVLKRGQSPEKALEANHVGGMADEGGGLHGQRG